PSGTLNPQPSTLNALRLAAELGWQLEPSARVVDLALGARQRLEIVKALARRPAVLVLDEPTAVLTPRETEELFRVLRRLREEGVGIVFISHKLVEVLQLCDRVTVLRRGRNVAATAVAATSA